MTERNIETRQQPPQILFVDDEKNILAALNRLMMEDECQVHTASSGEEGLEVLRREQGIALIVSDQRMPGMNGARFLELAREIAPEAIRFILTGYADIQATMDAINCGGAHRYITKPWNDEELHQTIRDALRRYALAEENRRLAAIIEAQNEELKEWNARLKSRVLQQTGDIRLKNEELDRRNLQLQRNFQNTIAAFSSILELRGKKLRHHSRNVTALTGLMAEALSLHPAERETLRVASLLHDIGEIGNPDHLLHEDIHSLEGKDLDSYMKHTVRGQAAIDSIEDLRGAGVLIRHHHEFFDGRGYPDRLCGETIPLGSRLIHIADFLDRRIAHQQDLDPAAAFRPMLTEVQKHLGTWFDPQLFPHLEEAARAVYGQILPREEMIRQNIEPWDLISGMILDEDLVTGTGLMLLSKGSVLTRKSIESILRYNRLDPLYATVAVLIRA